MYTNLFKNISNGKEMHNAIAKNNHNNYETPCVLAIALNNVDHSCI